jgi:toxin YoeB
MTIRLTAEAREDYAHWQATDARVLQRIDALIADASRRCCSGLGSPAPLKGELEGWWSRRIAGEHRLVYCLQEARDEAPCLVIAACRYHYGL